MKKILAALRSVLPAKDERPRCCAVVVAAGKGERMNSAINKQFIEISKKPILAYCLETLEGCDCIDEIVVVAREEEIFNAADLVRCYGISKVKQVIKGGETRQDSVLCGLGAVNGRYEFVAVHDGARPFVRPDEVHAVVCAAIVDGAAALGVRVTDTVKECDEDGFIIKTVDRSRLWNVQTPQVFAVPLLWSAYQRVAQKNLYITDECMAAEAMGIKVKMVEGCGDNIKITTPNDLALAETILYMRGECK